MAHDYQYWRRARRTNTAPYRFFSAKGGGEDVVVTPDMPTVAKMPERAPTAKRTANTAYWCHNEAMIGDDVFVHTRLPERAPGKVRTANPAYWRDNKLQINDEVPTNDRIFSRNPPVRRAANTAYFVNPTAVVADVTNLPPIVPVITDFARAKARTANTAYWQALRFQIGDEVPQNGRILDQVHPYRRTANTAYFVKGAVDLTELGMPSAPNLTDFARRATRSANTAYSVTTRVFPEIEFPPIMPVIADIHRPYRRAAATEYWRNSQFVVDDSTEPPPIFPFISDIARRHRYNSATAPWRWIGIRGGGLEVEPINDTIFPGPFEYRRAKLRSARQNYQFAGARQLALLFKPEGTILFPDHNNTTRRRKEAANTAYWRPNTGQIVYVDFPEELSAKLLPVRYWTPLRAGNAAYWKNNPGPIPVIAFSEELSAKLLPNRAPGARRGANTIYSIATHDMEDTVAFDSVIGAILLPDRARSQRRAAEWAYWMPPQFLVQFGASLAPLIIGKARVQTLWANDREFIIPAKRRKFPQKPKRP